ncbi:MAG: hypothetical protein ACP5KI_01700 [Brevinematia bacterium]
MNTIYLFIGSNKGKFYFYDFIILLIESFYTLIQFVDRISNIVIF